ncbi:MAG: hypothetical protein RBT33_03670 [Candidatus Dojkabacteria bacterium]|jgi:nitrogen fixation-related uncharacterized protein|nr:hypothetical protein [Candidatus Dojkabacteria bacterium]
MENNPNDLQNSVLQTVQPTKKKGISQKVLLIIIAILLFLLLILSLFFMYKNGTFDSLLKKESEVQQEDKEKEDITDQNKEENIQPKESYYEGETVKALLPDGWSVEEYYDGEGTDSLVEGAVYEGFTGLKIKKGSEEIFSVRAVSGIGFIGCPMYAKFSDYSPAHLESNQSMADEIGEPMNITDYTSTKYSEFKWLGRDFRRIGLTYFYDEEPNNDYFEAPCVSGVLTIEGLNFTDSDGFTGEAYFYGASMNASEEDLLVVDEILDSMTLQK